MWSSSRVPSGQQLLMQQKQQHYQPAGLHFFPVQVGPPTIYALSRKNAFVGVLIFQALMTIVRCLEDEFRSIPVAIIMGVGVLIGWYAWKENMNITYICWWTVFSFIGLCAGIVLAIFSFAIQISTIVVLCVIPTSCFCGVVLGWWLYDDYEEEYQTNDILSSWLRYFGILTDHSKAAMMLNAAGLAGRGHLAQAGAVGASAGFFGDFFGGHPANAHGSADLAKYGAQYRGQANQFMAGAQDQGQHWWNRGSHEAAAMQAQADGRFGNLRGQAAEKFSLFEKAAQQEYGSVHDAAAARFGDLRGKATGHANAAQQHADQQASGLNSWLAGFSSPFDTAEVHTPGPPHNVHRDPFITA